MKFIKILLSTMFVFTAVIQRTEVKYCGTRRYTYLGIRAYYIIKDDTGRQVQAAEESACAANWSSLQTAIKFNLKAREITLNAAAMEFAERERMNKEASELIGVEVRGQ